MSNTCETCNHECNSKVVNYYYRIKTFKKYKNYKKTDNPPGACTCYHCNRLKQQIMFVLLVYIIYGLLYSLAKRFTPLKF